MIHLTMWTIIHSIIYRVGYLGLDVYILINLRFRILYLSLYGQSLFVSKFDIKLNILKRYIPVLDICMHNACIVKVSRDSSLASTSHQLESLADRIFVILMHCLHRLIVNLAWHDQQHYMLFILVLIFYDVVGPFAPDIPHHHILKRPNQL